MKMYILVRAGFMIGNQITSVAHASLAVFLKFQDTPEMKEWLDTSFRKVICKVNDSEFEKAKEVEDHVVITESSLGHQEIAIAFKPRDEWPKAFNYYRLFK